RRVRRLLALRLRAVLAALAHQLQLTGNQHQLPMRITPLAQAHVVEEVLLAPGAQRVAAQLLALLLEAAPKVDQRGEVRVYILPLRVRLVGGLLAIHRSLARVLHRQRGGDDKDFLKTALLGALQHHAPQARVDGQARQLPADGRDLAFAVNRRQLLQQVEAVADGLAVWRLDKGEVLDAAQAQVQHLQDYRRQVGAQDLRSGKFRAPEKIFLAVQTNANARLDPPATALALVGAG